MKMAQQEVDQIKQEKKWIIDFYVREIYLFEKKTTKLLLKTILHETKLEKIKQQKLRVSEEDIDELHELITLTLKAIAIVDTYENFLRLLIPPSKENNEMFFAQREQRFENLLMVFLLKVKTAEEIDFSISR